MLGHVYAANGQKAKAVCKIKCNREAEAVSGTCKVPLERDSVVTTVVAWPHQYALDQHPVVCLIDRVH